MNVANNQQQPIKIIAPGRSSIIDYLRDIWHFRKLVLVFAKQEFKSQFIQTKLNWLWIILKPLMVLSIFALIFDSLIHFSDNRYPYTLFAISGLLLWNNFNFMVNNGGNVLVDNRAVIKKMYFPRVVFVLAKSLFSLVEVAINTLILLILSLWIGYPLSVNIIFAPLFVIATLILGLGFSLWMNALTVRQRDLHQFVLNYYWILF